MFYILAQLTTFYNRFLYFNAVKIKLRSQFKPYLISAHFRTEFVFHRFPQNSAYFRTELFFPQMSVQFYHSVEMWGNSAEMYGNIVLILLGNSAEFRRKDFCTVLRNSTEISCPG